MRPLISNFADRRGSDYKYNANKGCDNARHPEIAEPIWFPGKGYFITVASTQITGVLHMFDLF